ncbi:sensor histidine kinase [Lachnospiraceae bacterium 54-11]
MSAGKTKETAGVIGKSYLKEKYKLIFCYIFIAFLFFVVSFLYGYRQIYRNMLYALELALFFGFLFFLWDFLTYYRRCQALMRALKRGEERTQGLPEAKSLPEQLYREMLEDSEKEKRKLLTEYDEKRRDMADYYTMWTHQIKTPIAAMRLLLQEEGAAACKDSLQKEREELFKIEQYAEMALYFARLDSLSSDFLFRKYDVQEIVKQAVKKYSVLFLHSGLSFRMEEFEIKAVTDEKWLCFVVEQVFSNALKYTHEGGIAIYGANAEGGEVRGRASYLVIEDTGIGIRESDLPRIFERGFTGYNGRMDKRSTGLGLYLCEQIMKRMSHIITVKSAQGKGTKVILGFMREM